MPTRIANSDMLDRTRHQLPEFLQVQGKLLGVLGCLRVVVGTTKVVPAHLNVALAILEMVLGRVSADGGDREAVEHTQKAELDRPVGLPLLEAPSSREVHAP